MKQKGFTLIELMIVVTLLIVVTGTSFVTISKFTQTQGVQDDGKTLLSEIKRVYSKAIGVVYPSVACTTLSGYTVSGTAGGQDLTVVAICNGGAGNVTETRKGVLRTSKFRSSFSFTLNAGNGDVTGAPVLIYVDDMNNASVSKTISVYSNGVYKIN